jgi:phosphoglucosamine mutase
VKEFATDGRGRINDKCGATHLEGVKSFLTYNREIIDDPRFTGVIANDGDADRMMGVGLSAKDGKLVDLNGNHALLALAQGEPGIVGTEYTNSALVRRLASQGIGFEQCPNGDVHVTEALLAKQAADEDWRRGGEFTGHHVVLDWLWSGDGVRNGAWFAAYAVRHGKTFGDLYDDLPLWAEKMAQVTVLDPTQRKGIKKQEAVRTALEQAADQLGKNGRIILRPSGTEPLVRIWGESPDKILIGDTIAELARTVESQIAA